MPEQASDEQELADCEAKHCMPLALGTLLPTPLLRSLMPKSLIRLSLYTSVLNSPTILLMDIMLHKRNKMQELYDR